MERLYKNISLDEAEDKIIKYVDQEVNEYDEIIIEEDEYHQLLQCNYYIHVPEHSIKICDIWYAAGYKDDGIDYEKQFKFWLIRDFDTDEIIYEGKPSDSIQDVLSITFDIEIIDLLCDIYTKI